MKRIRLNKTATITFAFVWLYLIVFTACDVRVFEPDDKVDNTNFFAAESFSFDDAVKNQARLNLGAINGPVDVVGVPGATTARLWGERRVESENEADAKNAVRQPPARRCRQRGQERLRFSQWVSV